MQTDRLMLFMEIISVYADFQLTYINKLLGQNSKLLFSQHIVTTVLYMAKSLCQFKVKVSPGMNRQQERK
jgi:hypothetical protein